MKKMLIIAFAFLLSQSCCADMQLQFLNKLNIPILYAAGTKANPPQVDKTLTTIAPGKESKLSVSDNPWILFYEQGKPENAFIYQFNTDGKQKLAIRLIASDRGSKIEPQTTLGMKISGNITANDIIPIGTGGAATIRAPKQVEISTNPKQMEPSGPAKKFTPIAEIMPEERPQSGILMFFDQSEENFYGALSSQLFTAIEQQAGPILVNSFLFNAFLQARQINSPLNSLIREKLTTSVSEAEKNNILNELNKYIKEKSKIISTDHKNRWGAIVVQSSFNPRDWMMCKAYGDQMYLLIPHTYIKKIDPSFDGRGKASHELALKMGLALDKLEQLPTDNLAEYVKKLFKKFDFNRDNITRLFNTIFITNAGYYKENRSTIIPMWTIYMIGHGLVNDSIANIPVAAFPAVLEFFENKITTKLLVYNSCYAAGVNIEVVYKDVNKQPGTQKTYSYAIITSALTDEVVTSLTFPNFTFSAEGRSQLNMSDIIWQEHRLSMTLYGDFGLFLQRALAKTMPIDYATIIAPIVPLANQYNLTRISRTGAQIRLPGLAWFSVVDAQNRVVTIGRVLASTRGDKPLNIADFFKQQRPVNASGDLAAILLYTNNIPFVLDIKSIPKDKWPKIISMIPGSVKHKLAGIEVSSDSGQQMNDIAGLFSVDTSGDVCKSFMIDKIGYKDSNGSWVAISSEVFIDCNEKIFFKLNGVPVELVRKGNIIDASSHLLSAKSSEAKKYQAILKEWGVATSTAQEEITSVATKLQKIQEEHAKKVTAGKGLEYTQALPAV